MLNFPLFTIAILALKTFYSMGYNYKNRPAPVNIFISSPKLLLDNRTAIPANLANFGSIPYGFTTVNIKRLFSRQVNFIGTSKIK